MDKEIIISYNKNFDNNGYVYNQVIKITENIASKFNKYLEERKANIYIKNKLLSDKELKILCTNYLISNENNYLTLTGLQLFIDFYLEKIYKPPKKDKTFERILWRNTMIKVI